MFKRLCLTLLFLIHTATACYGLEVVAVKSSPAQPYEAALQAFTRHLSSLLPSYGTKAIHPDFTISTITLTKQKKAEVLRHDISKNKPDLIIALGSQALRLTASITDIPIIYLLVPSPEKVIDSQANITGILLQPEAGAQFRALKKIMPTVKRIGVLYDPKKTARLVDNVANTNNDLILVRRPTRSPQEVAGHLASLEGEIDLLWMVPDSTTLTPQTEKSFYRFAHQQGIPILAFSEKYLARGASFATELDIEEMGRMAASVALRITKGEKPKDIAPGKRRRVTLKINHTVIDKLGLELKEAGP